MAEERGTLNDGEPHPAAQMAKEYIANLPAVDLAMLQESLSSCAIEGNRLAEVCGETLRRLMAGEAVSDRYLLGLCAFISIGFHKPVIEKKEPELRKDGVRDAIAYLQMVAERLRGGSPERIALFRTIDMIEHDMIGKKRNRLAAFKDDETKSTFCNHCGGPIRIRNPKGYCDHLYYPEYCDVCKEEKQSHEQKKIK